MSGARGTRLLDKAGYGLACIVALVLLAVTGYAHYVHGKYTSFGSSDAISGSSPTVGAMNILVMGLESRTDYNGRVLPEDLLRAMHAGSRYAVQYEGVGGQATNTLILIHIFAGGQAAVGFSIPRDDWVTFPQPYDGQSQGKIDQAYGLAWAQSLNGTANAHMSRDQRYFLANEAGQKAAIATVSAVTGQQINHFAELNLAGYYELAKAFGGIEVCVKSWNGGQNLTDVNSGAHLRVGYQHLDAGQALAFVRERDNLPDGDISRTHRQQAVIDYVIWKLEHQGILASLGQLTNLLDVAKRYVITDSSFNIAQFAGEMKSLSGSHLTFSTLPIVGYHTYYLNGVSEDANQIDIPAIKAEVRKAFAKPPATKKHHKKHKKHKKPRSYPFSADTADVYNAGYTNGLAGQVSAGLVGAGFKQGQIADYSSIQSATQVLYGTGASARANAAKVAGLFGVTAQSGSSVAAGHIEVILGSGATLPSFSSLASGSSGSGGSGSAGGNSSGAGSSGTNAFDNQGTISVKANAPYGIPCVY
jgi:LCP family protein required for cell wall assembly